MLHTLFPAIALLLSIFVTSAAIAQDQPKNNLYLEVGGNGLHTSINYERQLTPVPRLQVRAGVGFYSEKGLHLTLPLGISYLFPLKDKRSFVDAGLGATWALDEGRLSKRDRASTESFFNIIPTIGYRRHMDTNIMWRISVGPVINDVAFTPWAGLSVGRLF